MSETRTDVDPAALSDAELSAAVAREVMGQDLQRLKSRCHRDQHDIHHYGGKEGPYCYTCYRYWSPGGPSGWDGKYHACPPYASDIGAAWRVVELLMSWHYEFQLESTIPFPERPTRWWACFDAGGRNPQKDGSADTPGRAICLAALHAVKDHGRNVAVVRAER